MDKHVLAPKSPYGISRSLTPGDEFTTCHGVRIRFTHAAPGTDGQHRLHGVELPSERPTSVHADEIETIHHHRKALPA